MTIKPPLFLIGAGFNVDAAAERGAVEPFYPQGDQLASICFGLPNSPSDRSIEDLFAEAIASKNRGPIDKLCDSLMKADYFVATYLSEPTVNSSYRTFLSRFSTSHFLTFNFDALLEIMLFRLCRWRPEDGYGVPVQVKLREEKSNLPSASTNIVLHLHGSLCVCTSESYVQWTRSPQEYRGINVHRKEPQFAFDADSICGLFPYYDRVLIDGYHPLERRVIAPVPSKATGLQGAFVQKIYQRARGLLSEAECVISIGYRFSPHDRESFDPIVRCLAAKPEASMVLISPHASEIRRRLALEYPNLHVDAFPLTFRTWVLEGCPGVT
jgi:hypothetical protein